MGSRMKTGGKVLLGTAVVYAVLVSVGALVIVYGGK